MTRSYRLTAIAPESAWVEAPGHQLIGRVDKEGDTWVATPPSLEPRGSIFADEPLPGTFRTRHAAAMALWDRYEAGQ